MSLKTEFNSNINNSKISNNQSEDSQLNLTVSSLGQESINNSSISSIEYCDISAVRAYEKAVEVKMKERARLSVEREITSMQSQKTPDQSPSIDFNFNFDPILSPKNFSIDSIELNSTPKENVAPPTYNTRSKRNGDDLQKEVTKAAKRSTNREVQNLI